ETVKGRIGLVGMYSETGGQSRPAGTDDVGITGGRAGLNSLGVTRAGAASAGEMAAPREINGPPDAARLEYSNAVQAPAAEPANQIDLFGSMFKMGTKPGELTYTMNRGDLQDNLKSIKNGKQYADFMIATIHAHQSATLLQPFLFEEEPPDFLISLAHQSIDNGADAFVGHGPHILRA